MLYIVILAKTNEHTKHITENLLKSINESSVGEYPFDKVQTIVVESGDDYAYDCSTTIHFNGEKFNYNHACNIALDEISKTSADDDWICFMNNDIICDADWILEMSNAYKRVPSLGSMCPNTNEDALKDISKNAKVLIGYILKKTFNGCCFVLKMTTLKTIGKFDETFNFYFQDDDVLEQLRQKNIQHGLVLKSKITHIGQATTGAEDRKMLQDCAKLFIQKYSFQTYIQREIEKLAQFEVSHKQKEHK